MIEKHNTKPGPIGIFDSGYGGLTILDGIRRLLPEYDYLYIGDNARAPYGSRSFDVVYEFTLQAVEKLFDMGCPLVILGCNTASAKALRTIQQNDLKRIDPSRRVLGVIRPTVEAIGTLTHNQHVGLLATEGTVLSESYNIELKKLYPSIEITAVACPMWVHLVENNQMNTPGAEYFVQLRLEQLLQKDPDIDTIILGCTHFPLLLPLIRKHVPPHIHLLAQGNYVAESLKNYLLRHPEIDERCAKNGQCDYYTTENPLKFQQSASIFLKESITAKHINLE